jgi:hypothetical protein
MQVIQTGCLRYFSLLKKKYLVFQPRPVLLFDDYESLTAICLPADFDRGGNTESLSCDAIPR